MATRERYQNPVLGDTINLRLFTFNSNLNVDPFKIDRVDVYWLDDSLKSASNSDGRTLIQQFSSADIQHIGEGQYLLPVFLNPYKTVSGSEEFFYRIGDYIDAWWIIFEGDENATKTENEFKVYPDLWYASPMPMVYDFDFEFSPNKLIRGSKQYLIVGIKCMAPGSTAKEQYYQTLAVLGNLGVSISVSTRCDCYDTVYPSRNIIVDKASVSYRDNNRGYYLLDTTKLPTTCSLFDIWFTYDYGGNTFISPKFALQIL